MLEQEHTALQLEILRSKMNNAAAATSLTTAANTSATAAIQASASPSVSPASVRSSSFTSFWRGGHRKNKSSVSTVVECAPPVKSVFVAETEDVLIMKDASKRPQNQGGGRERC